MRQTVNVLVSKDGLENELPRTTMHNQSDVTWPLRYCAGTYARFIVEDSDALETVFRDLVLEAG